MHARTQLLGRFLDNEDLASARLACSEWREHLSAQVQAARLPAHLWQHCVPGQVVGLYRLLDSFRHLQDVRLALDPQHTVDSWSMGRATDTLRRALPTLRRLELAGVQQPAHWRAALGSMQCIAPQLTALRLQDIAWPPLDALHMLAPFSSLRALAIASPHFSRLEAGHLAAIAQLTQLSALTLRFRTVAGTASAPLALDSLSCLVRLVQLDVQYSGARTEKGRGMLVLMHGQHAAGVFSACEHARTYTHTHGLCWTTTTWPCLRPHMCRRRRQRTGLLELSSVVVFCKPAALAALSSLRSLAVSLIPMPSLAALSRLPHLTSLALQQAQPLGSGQCSSLARCMGLRDLSLCRLQWADLPQLAALTRLTALAVQVWQPSRGHLPGDPSAGQQLLSLRALARLQRLQLRGQVELPAELLARLAGCWGQLTALDLCCVLPDGTQGLQAFSELRSLAVRPYKWDGERDVGAGGRCRGGAAAC
jgi:hypothetical protein